MRRIIWSHKAEIKLFSILEFYKNRNKSASYSRKLYKKFKSETHKLIKQPNIGVLTDLESIRGLIVDDFILFYQVADDIIIIHTIWDCRQNPESLSIK